MFGRRGAATLFQAAPGQVVITTTGASTWTVPLGVYSISMVAVQSGADVSSTGTDITVASTVVCRAKNSARIGDGGGDGGLGGNGFNDFVVTSGGGGGGGAGGYSGNGGNGGSHDANPGSAGAGGGGGGGAGAGGSGGSNTWLGAGGGGVGLLGSGANGAGGTIDFMVVNGGGGGSSGTAGGGGSSSVAGAGGTYGAGAGGDPLNVAAPRGGALSYKNAIAVTPGSSVSLNIPGTNGAVRIMWGGARSYPSNAGDL